MKFIEFTDIEDRARWVRPDKVTQILAKDTETTQLWIGTPTLVVKGNLDKVKALLENED